MRCCWIVHSGPLTEFSRHNVCNGVKEFVIRYSQRDTDQCTHMNAIYRVCVWICVCALLLCQREREIERAGERGSCRSDNEITPAMWHRVSVTSETHVCEGSQADGWEDDLLYAVLSFRLSSFPPSPSLHPPSLLPLSSSPLFRSLQRCHHSACF